MLASTFDALEASREFKQAGIEQPPAEALAEQLRTAAGADLDPLATNIGLTFATLAAVLGLAWTLLLELTTPT